MTQKLSGRPIAKKMKSDHKELAEYIFPNKDKYVAIIFLGEDPASATYVNMKQKYGQDIGVEVKIFGQQIEAEKGWNNSLSDSTENIISLYQKHVYEDAAQVIELIHYLNSDNDCVGILVQLPLPEPFLQHKAQILAQISPKKDIDGLGGRLFGYSTIDFIDFVPATPKSVLTLLEYYELNDVQGKFITILGQSNLVGKPLALELMKMGATVYSTNHFHDSDKIKEMTKKADYIISCTGQVHLIDESYVRDDQTQILVDVGYGFKDGKPVGDMQLSSIKESSKAYTPVPGGIGPLTVACLFDNVFVLQKQKGNFT